MYIEPCARLTKFMMPKTSVRPAAMRNSRTPSCRPLSAWMMNRLRLTIHPCLTWRAALVPAHHDRYCLLFQAALLGEIGTFGDLHRRQRLQNSFAVFFDHVNAVEGCVREMVGIELEVAAHGIKVGFLQSGNECFLVGQVATHLADGGIQQAGGIPGLRSIHGWWALVGFLESFHEGLVLRVVDVG